MIEKNIKTELFKYIILNVLGMVGISCYILADTFFVSAGMGSAGIAALNIALPVYSLVHGSGLMIGVGGACQYSIFVSRGDKKGADRMFTAALAAAAVMSAVYMITGIAFSGKIAGMLGADEAVFEMTETYLKTILIMSPSFLAGDIFTCFVRNDKAPGLSMAAMIAASLSNIVLDYIFIFSMKMGIFGAALATGMAPCISMAVLSRHRMKEQRFRAVKSMPAFKEIKRIIAGGTSSLVTELSAGIIMALFNFLILNAEGNIGVAAYGIIANLSLVAIAIFTGIAQGMQPLASKVHGISDKYSEGLLLKYSVLVCTASAILIYVVLTVFSDGITAVFNSENNIKLMQLAETGIRLYFIMLPFAGINIITSMFFAAVEKPVSAQVISLSRGFVVIVPAVIIGANSAGLTGIWLSVSVSEFITLVIGTVLYIRFRKPLHK